MSRTQDKEQEVFRSFPSVDVEIKARVLLHRGYQSIYTDHARLSSRSLYVQTEEHWPIGALVDVEFTLAGDLRPYLGEGRVARLVCGMPGGDPSGLELEFTRLAHKKLGLGDRLRELDRVRRVGTQIAVEMVHYFLHNLRGDRIPEKDFGQPGAGHRLPVLIIHGFLGTRGAMLPLENRLKQSGFPVLSFPLGVLNLDDIAKSAQRIADKIESLRRRHGFNRIDVVGHSMGGLIALYYIKRLGGAKRVRRLVTIGTPHQGASLAFTSIILMPWTGLLGKGVWQILPGSRFLEELHRGALPKEVEITSVIAKGDLVVHPNHCVLQGARNVMLATSHAGLVVSPKTFNLIEEIFSK